MSQGIGPEIELVAGANVESCFVNFFEPQCGQGVPCHRLERTSNSNSQSQLSQ